MTTMMTMSRYAGLGKGSRRFIGWDVCMGRIWHGLWVEEGSGLLSGCVGSTRVRRIAYGALTKGPAWNVCDVFRRVVGRGNGWGAYVHCTNLERHV